LARRKPRPRRHPQLVPEVAAGEVEVRVRVEAVVAGLNAAVQVAVQELVHKRMVQRQLQRQLKSPGESPLQRLHGTIQQMELSKHLLQLHGPMRPTQRRWHRQQPRTLMPMLQSRVRLVAGLVYSRKHSLLRTKSLLQLLSQSRKNPRQLLRWTI
jgi:hypothetical protein